MNFMLKGIKYNRLVLYNDNLFFLYLFGRCRINEKNYFYGINYNHFNHRS